MNMGQKINQLRLQKGFTLGELGNLVGVGKSTVRKWENGMIANMKRDKILLVAEALDTSPAYLMGWDEGYETPPKQSTTIPVLGSVPAGIPIEAIQDIIDYEEIDAATAAKGEYFALQVKGSSMEPRICEGDIVIVRKQDDVESGEIAIVMVNGDNATIKRLLKYEDGIRLMPTNPAYEPLYFTNDEILEKPVKVIGKVIENRQKY